MDDNPKIYQFNNDNSNDTGGSKSAQPDASGNEKINMAIPGKKNAAENNNGTVSDEDIKSSRIITNSPVKTGGILPFISYALGLFLLISFVTNIVFMKNISSLRDKMKENSRTVRSILDSKEKVLQEKAEIINDLEKIKNQQYAGSKEYAELAKTKIKLENDLLAKDEKLAELEKEIKTMVDDTRDLASKELGYYHSYTETKKENDFLEEKISNLETLLKDSVSEKNILSSKLAQKDAENKYNTAFAYAQARQFDKAIKYFEDYLEVYGDDPDIHYNLGYIYDAVKGDTYKAVYHYTMYMKLKPEAEDFYEVKARVSSLERGAKKPDGPFSNYNVNTETMKP